MRNLPLKLTDQHLKKVFSTAAGGKPARIKKVLIMRSKDRLDSTGLGRPLGFGFVEFTNQSEALAALRATNNNPALFGADRRPIVEFSIENSLALKARQQRLQRSKQRQHGNEAAKQGQAPKTNKEKRQERKLRRIEKRKAKRVTRKQNEGSATDSQNNSNTSLVEGPKKSKIKDISQKRKGAEFKKKKPRVDLVEKQAFPGKRKFPFSASAPGADAQKSAKGSEAAKSNFQTKKQRKGARKKQRDGKEESNFNAMVANYKNKLFSPAVPATSGAKRTRWFE